MAVIDIQKALGVSPDGWYGDNTHAAYLASGKLLAINWPYLRRKFGGFNQQQVDGFLRIVAACNKPKLRPQHAAYILATGWHETAHTMTPVREYGRGRGRPYGTWLTNSKGEKYAPKNGNRKNPTYYVFSDYPFLYYGQGDVQLTWWDNYKRATEELGVDFLNNPALALVPEHSADIIVTGSMQGWFTGKSIPDYISYGHYSEMVNARRVINGTDKDDMIARYAKIFLTALELAE